ncbi:sigma D regulator [Spongorhabdus nitratireducens]
MLEGCKTARERWGGVSDIVDRWLNERQDLIVLYCSINGVTPEEDQRPVQDKLEEFCQLLVDYVSAGHFEVYEQLVREGHEFDDGGIEETRNIFPTIEDNTQICLDFNDSCGNFSSLTHMKDELSKMGERLADRFEMEDKLIEVLHNRHRELVN